jgi:hypothetical protein
MQQSSNWHISPRWRKDAFSNWMTRGEGIEAIQLIMKDGKI